MNDDEAQWTSSIDPGRLASLVSLASNGKVLTTGSAVAGFVPAMASSCGYKNGTFDWPRNRYEDFRFKASGRARGNPWSKPVAQAMSTAVSFLDIVEI